LGIGRGGRDGKDMKGREEMARGREGRERGGRLDLDICRGAP